MKTFKKEERLCSKKAIELLFSKGKSFYEYPLRIIWMHAEIPTPFPAQVIITVSKKSVPGAVKRNLLKRRIREAYRKNKFSFYEFLTSANMKCVFAIIYTSRDILEYKEIEAKIILILQRLSLIQHAKHVDSGSKSE
jgi:ribonuclease P protein component